MHVTEQSGDSLTALKLRGHGSTAQARPDVCSVCVSSKVASTLKTEAKAGLAERRSPLPSAAGGVGSSSNRNLGPAVVTGCGCQLTCWSREGGRWLAPLTRWKILFLCRPRLCASLGQHPCVWCAWPQACCRCLPGSTNGSSASSACCASCSAASSCIGGGGGGGGCSAAPGCRDTATCATTGCMHLHTL
jgi:hypothetical protein